MSGHSKWATIEGKSGKVNPGTSMISKSQQETEVSCHLEEWWEMRGGNAGTDGSGTILNTRSHPGLEACRKVFHGHLVTSDLAPRIQLARSWSRP